MADSNESDGPMKPEIIEDFFAALEIAEKRDLWGVIEFWLNSRAFANIERHADANLLQRLTTWREKLAAHDIRTPPVAVN